MNANTYYPGLDLLKFILAILIIATHTQLFEEIPILHQLIAPIKESAVPTFFAISAYLFVQRINNCNNNYESGIILKKNIKRLLTIFCIWYILMLPMTYFRFFSVANLKETVYAILLSCTFNGYWFFKALIINTIILYYCRSKNKLLISSIVFFFVYIFWSYNYIFNYYSINISPYYSFYYHTFYFYIGALMAHYERSLGNPKTSITFFLYIVVILLSLNSVLFPIGRLLIPCILIILFKNFAQSFNKQILLRMRALSILLYVTQFMIIWIYNNLCNDYLNHTSDIYQILQYSVTRFIVVLSIALGFSLLILRLEKKPSLSFLKKLH